MEQYIKACHEVLQRLPLSAEGHLPNLFVTEMQATVQIPNGTILHGKYVH